jgi:hypothetical protein
MFFDFPSFTRETPRKFYGHCYLTRMLVYMHKHLVRCAIFIQWTLKNTIKLIDRQLSHIYTMNSEKHCQTY